MAGIASGLLRLLRPKQWLKNALVFGPLIFANAFGQIDNLIRAFLCFLAMCLLSSATYVFNDIADVERDRRHPRKRLRPIAAGQVTVPTAVCCGAMLLVVGILIAYGLNRSTLYLAVVYLALQVLYNLFLKRVPVADAFVLAAGFVLRAVIGAAAIQVSISGWLLFCTGALALMFGFAKRRAEFVSQGEARGTSRESLLGYTRQSLDALFLMTAVASGICYGIYAIESRTAKEHPTMVVTTVFVIYAICRYVLLVFNRDEGEEPESLMVKDGQLLGCLVGFLIVSVWAMRATTIPLLETDRPAIGTTSP